MAGDRRTEEARERRRQKKAVRRVARAATMYDGDAPAPSALLSPSSLADLEEITRGIAALRIDTLAEIGTLASRVGALEGLANPANGPISAAAAGPPTSTSTVTSTSDNGAAVTALSVRIRELETRAKTDLSSTQVSIALAEARIAGLEARAAEADALEERVHDLEGGLRSVAELMGQWAGRQLNRDEVAEAVGAEDDDSVQ